MSWNNFKAPNLGLLIYKRLYQENGIVSLIKFNNDKKVIEIQIPQNEKFNPFDELFNAIYNNTLNDNCFCITNKVATNKFVLYTTYPGLLCGSGYTHDSNSEGDIKMGFFFDHTTGQPAIPGSSVKGVLKRVFENENDKTDGASVAACKFFTEEIIAESDEKDKGAWQLILDTCLQDEANSIKFVNELKESIFGTQDGEGIDIFYDAVISFENTKKGRKFLANDFITPHVRPGQSYEESMLKNPIPLMFLKVLPNIAFEFRFTLKDSFFEITGTDKQKKVFSFSAAKKETLFKKILLTLGVGAKTNVGYGQFSEKAMNETKSNTGSRYQTATSKNFLLKNETFKSGQPEINVKVKVADNGFIFLTEKGSEFYKSKDSVYNKFTDMAAKKYKQFVQLTDGMEIKIRINADINPATDTANFTVLPVYK